MRKFLLAAVAAVAMAAGSLAAAEEADWVRRPFFNGVLSVSMPPDWISETHGDGINVGVMPDGDSPSRVLFTIPNPEFGDDIEAYLRENVGAVMERTADYGEAHIIEDRDDTFGGYPGYVIGFALGVDGEDPIIVVAMGVAHNGYCSMALSMTPRSGMEAVKTLGGIVETLRYDDEKLAENEEWLRGFAARAETSRQSEAPQASPE